MKLKMSSYQASSSSASPTYDSRTENQQQQQQPPEEDSSFSSFVDVYQSSSFPPSPNNDYGSTHETSSTRKPGMPPPAVSIPPPPPPPPHHPYYHHSGPTEMMQQQQQQQELQQLRKQLLEKEYQLMTEKKNVEFAQRELELIKREHALELAKLHQEQSFCKNCTKKMKQNETTTTTAADHVVDSNQMLTLESMIQETIVANIQKELQSYTVENSKRLELLESHIAEQLEESSFTTIEKTMAALVDDRISKLESSLKEIVQSGLQQQQQDKIAKEFKGIIKKEFPDIARTTMMDMKKMVRVMIKRNVTEPVMEKLDQLPMATITALKQDKAAEAKATAKSEHDEKVADLDHCAESNLKDKTSEKNESKPAAEAVKQEDKKKEEGRDIDAILSDMQLNAELSQLRILNLEDTIKTMQAPRSSTSMTEDEDENEESEETDHFKTCASLSSLKLFENVHRKISSERFLSMNTKRRYTPSSFAPMKRDGIYQWTVKYSMFSTAPPPSNAISFGIVVPSDDLEFVTEHPLGTSHFSHGCTHCGRYQHKGMVKFIDNWQVQPDQEVTFTLDLRDKMDNGDDNLGGTLKGSVHGGATDILLADGVKSSVIVRDLGFMPAASASADVTVEFEFSNFLFR